MDAARFWACGGTVKTDQEALQTQLELDSKLSGIPIEKLREAIEEDLEQDFAVWPENEESLELFLACMTQWRVDGFNGKALGLEYTGLHAAMEMMGISDRRQAFSDIRCMEIAVLKEMRRNGN